MNFSKMYALGLRHLYLISNSFPRILDLIYWPTVQIFLWGFISKFFTLNSEYYSNTVGVILTAAILYDFLFRASISFDDGLAFERILNTPKRGFGDKSMQLLNELAREQNCIPQKQ